MADVLKKGALQICNHDTPAFTVGDYIASGSHGTVNC